MWQPLAATLDQGEQAGDRALPRHTIAWSAGGELVINVPHFQAAIAATHLFHRHLAETCLLHLDAKAGQPLVQTLAADRYRLQNGGDLLGVRHFAHLGVFRLDVRARRLSRRSRSHKRQYGQREQDL